MVKGSIAVGRVEVEDPWCLFYFKFSGIALIAESGGRWNVDGGWLWQNHQGLGLRWGKLDGGQVNNMDGGLEKIGLTMISRGHA